MPFRVRDGWIAVYHGVSKAPMRYSLGALLLDANDPSRVLARSRDPILAPEQSYEREGFFGGVVFSCGLLAEGDTVRVYYGAADVSVAGARVGKRALVESLAEAIAVGESAEPL